jgi:hypothetical protein
MDSSCKRKDKIFNFGTNIYVHVIFLFAILSALFIFIISKLTTKLINNEIIDMVNDNLSDSYSNLNETQKQNTNNVLNIIPLDLLKRYYSKPDKIKETNNNLLFKKILTLLIILILVLFIVIGITKLLCHNLPLKHILIENIVIFTGIGIVEFSFFYFIIFKYIPTKPSFIASYIIDYIKKKIQ